VNGALALRQCLGALAVEPGADKACEQAAILQLSKVTLARSPVAQRIDVARKVSCCSQLFGQHVAGAQRHNQQRQPVGANPVDDFVDSPVAAHGNHGIKPLALGVSGQFAPVARTLG
jgi:hypothetical protein